MGFSLKKALGKAARVALGVSTGGLSEVVGAGKAVEQVIKGKASGTTVSSGSTEDEINNAAEDTSKRRVKLYATQGEELGEEYLNVNEESKRRRGKIFEN